AGVRNPVDASLRRVQAGNPLDQAILGHDRPDVRAYQKLSEIPFDFERRLVSVAVQDGDKRLLITKGAPESVITRCSSYERDGERRPMDESARASCEKTYQDFSGNGFRVLSVAYRFIDEQESYGISDEENLTLLGFVTFFDPPLEEAAEALQSLHRDGIRVKILTGDNALVAKCICEQVGLHVRRIVSG